MVSLHRIRPAIVLAVLVVVLGSCRADEPPVPASGGTGRDAAADSDAAAGRGGGTDGGAAAGNDGARGPDTGLGDGAGSGVDAAVASDTGATAAIGPAPVKLGTAGDQVVLAKTAISTVPPSHLTGDIGLSPAAATFVTGFSLVADASNVFSTSTQVVGKIYAANHAVPSPVRLTTAVSDMEGAYTDAAGRPTPDFLELGTGEIGGKTLAPGLYKWTSTVSLSTDVTLAGGANDVWIFQTSGDLSLAAAKQVTLAGGARAKNVFWQVAGQATFGANSHFEGILLCKTGITLQTGASMNGRALAQTMVALQKATITQPAP